MSFPPGTVNGAAATSPRPAYSLCSLVSDTALYARMVASFRAAGFADDDCEYLYLDNTGAAPQQDGYRGLNRLIARAAGEVILLCHQDVLAIDTRARLDACLAALTLSAPDWGVAGNAEYTAGRRKRFRLTDRHRIDCTLGPLPDRVASLDEDLLILRRDALLGFSHDLAGFHLYGSDLVLQAKVRGRSAHVVDWHAEHLGRGTMGQPFLDAMTAFEAKYRRALAPHALRTTVTVVGVGRGNLETRWRRRKLRLGMEGKKPFHRLLRIADVVKGIATRLRGPRALSIDGHPVTLPDDAPAALREALLRDRCMTAERAMIATWLPRDLPVLLSGEHSGLLIPAILARAGPDAPVTLHHSDDAAITAMLGPLPARCRIDPGSPSVPHSLIAPIGPSDLARLCNPLCRCAILTFDVPGLIDAGGSVGETLARLTGSGMRIAEVSGFVIVALRD